MGAVSHDLSRVPSGTLTHTPEGADVFQDLTCLLETLTDPQSQVISKTIAESALPSSGPDKSKSRQYTVEDVPRPVSQEVQEILAVLQQQVAEDPDWIRSEEGQWITKQRLWQLIDLAGTNRNAISAVATALQHAGTGTQAVSTLLACISFLSILGGGMLIYSGLRDNVKHAEQNLKEAEAAGDQEWINLAQAGLFEQYCYVGFGVGLMGSGSFGLFTEAGSQALSHILHTASVTLHGAEIATQAFGGFLGVLCVLRGASMFTRASYNYHQINAFDKGLKASLYDGETVKFLHTELNKGKDHFCRRVGKNAFEKLRQWDGVSKPSDEILKAIDKGLHFEKAKQIITIVIALLMITGGILTLLFTGGLSSFIILLAMSLVFTKMESVFLLFDTDSKFGRLVNFFYAFNWFFFKSKAEEFQELLDAQGISNEEMQRDIEWIDNDAWKKSLNESGFLRS